MKNERPFITRAIFRQEFCSVRKQNIFAASTNAFRMSVFPEAGQVERAGAGFEYRAGRGRAGSWSQSKILAQPPELS
jgi:hypothetical protein